MPKLIIPTPLRKFTEGKTTFGSDANSVGQLLENLATAHAGIRPHLFNEAGELRSFIRVYVGDEDIHELDGVNTALDPGTEVSIIPAIAGGIE
jgi:molybdopterin converting factor small subunit